MADSNPLNELFAEADQLSEHLLYSAFVAAWEKANTGKYSVHTSAVNWARYNFDQNPFAVAVFLYDIQYDNGVRKATVTFEVFCRTPAPPNGGEPKGMDTRLMAILYRDTIAVIEGTLEQKKLDGDTLYTMLPRTLVSQPTYSPAHRAQGVTSTFDINY